MGQELIALGMGSVSRIPEPCRSCVCWELDGSAATTLPAADRAFEKEAWLSGVMLTWGSAGLLAIDGDRTIGYAQFAPPTAVPGARAFPTGPVSADAVLLTEVRVEPGHLRTGVGRALVAGVIAALTRRGVRAVEAFGHQDEPEPEMPCLLPAGFLRAVGFTDIRPHHRYPRLRFELEAGSGWKAEVEAALGQLFGGLPPTLPTSAARVDALVG